mgnify:CR=1 FL=1
MQEISSFAQRKLDDDDKKLAILSDKILQKMKYGR